MIIETKFDIGQECYIFIGKDTEKVKIEKIIATIGKFEDETLTMYSITNKYGYAFRLPEEQLLAPNEQ